MNWAMKHENNGDISQQPKMKHKGKHDKPKPWDDDSNIYHWKIDKFNLSWNETGMLEVSSFSILFPRYRGQIQISHWFICVLFFFFGYLVDFRFLVFQLLCGEKYFQEVWPTVKPSLKEYGISCELNLVSFCKCFFFF